MSEQIERREPLGGTENKTAILVIHGIGQQDPYETLDQFAKGLVDNFEGATGQRPSLQPFLINHEGWNEVAIRLDLGGKKTNRGFSVLDLYEFYWAPHTEGKITYLQTLNWLRRTVLTPLRYLGYGYDLFSQPGRPTRLAGAFFREIVRSIFLFIPVAFFTYIVAYFLNKAGAVVTKAKVLLEIFRAAPLSHQFFLFILLAFGIFTLASLQALRVLRKERKVAKASGLRGISQVSLRRWTTYVVLSLILSVAATLGLGAFLRNYIYQFWQEVFRYHLVFPVIAGWIAIWLKRILVGYVGDIAVYVNADAKAASFQARSAILKEAREALLRLLRSPEGYNRILLAGHSLGSVIAYDLLNRFLDEVRASYATGPQGKITGMLDKKELERLQGLVTFGSPLDKIYYFFRTEVPAQQAIRAQILSYMHGFRRGPSGRAYGRYQFPAYTIPDPSPEFKWVNVWADADPVSGHLDFYEVAGRGTINNQFSRPYPLHRWGYAHVMYWADPVFYRIVADELL